MFDPAKVRHLRQQLYNIAAFVCLFAWRVQMRERREAREASAAGGTAWEAQVWVGQLGG
jgi:hypothetical protein